MIVIWLLIGIAIIIVVCIAVFTKDPPSDSSRDLNLSLELNSRKIERNKYNNEIFIYNPSISTVNGNRKNMYVTRRLSPDNIIIRNYIEATNRKKILNIQNEKLKDLNDTEMIEIETPNGEKFYKILDKKSIDNSIVPCGYEDPRIFNWKGEKWVIAYKRSLEVFRGFKHKIVIFSINNPDKEIYLDYNRRQIIEKNWMPFEYNDRLLVIYSFNPYIVLEVSENGKCSEIVREKKKLSDIKLDVGLGTPPIRINENSFLCMAHIRDMKQIPVRKNFFFTINSTDLKITGHTPIINFTEEPIEFGSGLDLLSNGNILISLGINDHFSIFGELPLKFILGLIPKQLDMDDLYKSPTFIINMERSTDRLNKVVTRIKDAGFKNISRFKAIDGSKENIPKLIKKLKLQTSTDIEFTQDESNQGRTLSHISLWQKIVDEKIPRANIFEDNIIFPEKWNKASEYIKETSFETDIIFMSNQTESIYAYTITYAGADKLLKMVKTEPIYNINHMIIEEMKRFAPSFSWVYWVNSGFVCQDKNLLP